MDLNKKFNILDKKIVKILKNFIYIILQKF